MKHNIVTVAISSFLLTTGAATHAQDSIKAGMQESIKNNKNLYVASSKIQASSYGVLIEKGNSPHHIHRLKGFATDMPLSTVVRQVAPAHWTVLDKVDSQLDTKMPVSWVGGKTWIEVIQSIASNNPVNIYVNWNKKEIKLLSVPKNTENKTMVFELAKPVTSQFEVQKAPIYVEPISAPQVMPSIPLATVIKERPVPLEVLQPNNTPPQMVLQVVKPASEIITPQSITIEPVKMQPVEKIELVETARTTQKIPETPKRVDEPVISREIVKERSVEIIKEPIKEIKTEVREDTIKPKETVKEVNLAPIEPVRQAWSMSPKMTLKENVQAWGKTVGVKVVWLAEDYPVEDARTLSGQFDADDGPVKQLSVDYGPNSRVEQPLSFQFFQNNTLVVENWKFEQSRAYKEESR